MTVSSYTKPQVYKDYDKSVADQLVHVLTYPPGVGDRPVLHVWATPERALAQVERKLRNRSTDSAQNVFPLAFISVDRIATQIDPKRFSRAWNRRSHYEYTDGELSGVYSYPWPIPVRLTYQINFWARNLLELQDLEIQFLFLFNHAMEKYISVEHSFPMGTRIVLTQLDGITKPSAIIEPEKQRRMREVATVIVNGWVTRAATRYGIVETVTTEIYESDDLETEDALLGTVVVNEDGRV